MRLAASSLFWAYIFLFGICIIAAVPNPPLYLQFGDDLTPAVTSRLVQLLQPFLPSVLPGNFSGSLPSGLVLALGCSQLGTKLILPSDLFALPAEGYILRSLDTGVSILVAACGKGAGDRPVNNGAIYAAYAALQALGLDFLHPLAPLVPESLTLPTVPLNVTTSPRWPVRGWHLHTMHPLELTFLLQGWGQNGADDEAGWQAMLGEWTLFLEWCAAQGLNRVEWVLLEAKEWQSFSVSATRQQRLQTLVQIGQQWGMWIGIDAAIALKQQHDFALVPDMSVPHEQQLLQMASRADFLMEAGFDYLSTEIGFSEFTTPSDVTMLFWLNETTLYLLNRWNRSTVIKCHCSTNEKCKDYGRDACFTTRCCSTYNLSHGDGAVDPRTGQPLNYNFLPLYAVPQLGIMPHTVEFYALNDPAPTYGNENFTYMLDFMFYEIGKRQVIYHPETAYWVSFDNSVPLFLAPIYAYNRVWDLQLIASRENASYHIDGQVDFDSGWEWGYWLQDVVTARASWDPLLEQSTEAALSALLTSALRSFGAVTAPVVQLLLEYAAVQRQLFIYGASTPLQPPTWKNGRLTGIAYLEGWDTWATIGAYTVMKTQPDHLSFIDLAYNPIHEPSYQQLEPLLAYMEGNFTSLFERLAAQRSVVPAVALPFFDDLLDSAHLLALRAQFVHALYDYVGRGDQPLSWRQQRLQSAEEILQNATVVVAQREAQYRVNPERIAGWMLNPTSYNYGYLWTVHSLFYWWRDYGEATKLPLNPCYLNIIDPVDVAFGEGILYNVTLVLRQLFNSGIIGNITECLAPPPTEPHYPPV